MDNDSKANVKLPAIGQIGIVVKDLNKVMEYYSSTFGIGPWQVMEAEIPMVKVRGEDCSFKGKFAIAQLGPVEIELIQVLSGKAIYSEFLDKEREGLHHLGFFVNREENDQIVAGLAKLGIGVLQGDNFGKHGSYAYLDTEGIGGVMFELINRPGSSPGTK